MTALSADQSSLASATPFLECGECTACCTLLAVAELNKPARWTCDHAGCQGCRVYDDRPMSCRAFNCLWLRGGLPSDPGLRPDKLGLMFDAFYSLATERERCVAFELWNGACDEPRAAELLNRMAREREIDLSFRDGTWRTIGTVVTVPQVASPSDSRQTGEICTTGGNRTEFDRI